MRNWKHTMLSHDDKEHGMHDEDARHGTEPVRDDPVPAPARDGRSRVCAGNATSSSRSWRPCGPNAWNSRSRRRPSYTRQLLGKERGADPDNLTNAGKTRLVLHPAGMFAMRPRDLWGRFGLSRSTFHHNRRRPDRPGRREWLVEPVMDAFRQSRERYGYRRIWQMPRERGIRVCARRVMRVMSAHGITPRFKSRRRYGSYSGERTPAPANLVDAASTPKAPNRLWAADITELHIGEGEIYLSPLIDCYDGMPVAWSIGTSPTAELADTMLEQACATLSDGERPVIHSDRGCHYRWPGWIRICERHGLTRSMSAKGLLAGQRRRGLLRPAQTGVLPQPEPSGPEHRRVHRRPRRLHGLVQGRTHQDPIRHQHHRTTTQTGPHGIIKNSDNAVQHFRTTPKPKHRLDKIHANNANSSPPRSNPFWRTTLFPRSRPACPQTAVRICLLYTSPSPRDPKTSRMPSSA